MSSDAVAPARSSHRILLGLGFPIILATAVLAVRIVWEETTLTIEQGPQMLGFSLAHGYFAFLMLGPPLLALWLIAALVVLAVSLWRKRKLSRWFWSSLVLGALAIGLLTLPEELFQWLFIGSFAESLYAAELMTYAAARGNVRTVQGYLEHGVPIEATNRDGSTAAYTAAVGGSVPTLALLASRGAKLNAINSYGDSPLEAANGMHREAAAAFLKAHGAVQIRGTEEQRNAASQAIVKRDIERQQRSH
jgi:hypothetical protein